MRRLPPLSSLRAFEAAARHGSFKRAADELAVTPTAISHRIRALEDATGLKLFVRQVRQVSLTDAGAQLYPVLREGFDAIEAVLARLTRTNRRERVTVSATHAFTAKWLVPRVGRFHALHPDIDLQLHASDETVDFDAHGIDLAVRYGNGPYPGLATEVMFADTYAPVVNPMLGVRSVADLQSVPLIHFDWKKTAAANPTWDAWFAHTGLDWQPSRGQLRYSDEGHAIQAAVAGQGVALLSLALVADELAAGYLVQPFGPAIPGHTYHLAMRADPPPGAAALAAAGWLRCEAEACKS
ncbi:LysR family transcriptional regulator [Massilia sp. Root133]|uniref:LysR substrate-binding domain-containing protein n=1 Tax=unclassified Massilia TaxID=2609279 RepID=UPI0006F2D855|nr:MULTISPECIES: LysR substrate-binding domain-containing protein [unclassified Massilia]KQY11777.1 LysR family transcriptional regulator [Massilia sp. Root133]KQZ34322.1 LysR family transcriptional regulator [Massilia sp. Root1485]